MVHLWNIVQLRPFYGRAKQSEGFQTTEVCLGVSLGEAYHFRHRKLLVSYPRVTRAIVYVVRGLIAFYWRTLLTSQDEITPVALTEPREKFFDDLFLATNKRIRGDLGNGTFKYEGSQSTDWPKHHRSVYRSLSRPQVPRFERIASSQIGALTGP
jgi:hypothetical protein